MKTIKILAILVAVFAMPSVVWGASIIVADVPASEKTTIDNTQESRHIVQKGDTVQSIAAMYGVPAEDVAKWNKMTVTTHLPPGTAITINPKDEAPVYTVKPGDTAESIAEMFGITVKELAQLNNLKHVIYSGGGKYLITVGNTLILPEGVSAKEKVATIVEKKVDLKGTNQKEASDAEKREERKAKLDAFVTQYENDPDFADIMMLIKLFVALDIIQV